VRRQAQETPMARTVQGRLRRYCVETKRKCEGARPQLQAFFPRSNHDAGASFRAAASLSERFFRHFFKKKQRHAVFSWEISLTFARRGPNLLVYDGHKESNTTPGFK